MATVVSFVGDGNVMGSHLTDFNNTYIFHISRTAEPGDATTRVAERLVSSGMDGSPPPEEERTLKSCAAHDALLHAAARHPFPRCHAGTRIRIQRIITDWTCRKGERADQGILLISGAPGVGKSAIMQTVCETLGVVDGKGPWSKLGFRDRSRRIEAVHFFSRNSVKTQKASYFPATIAYQLSLSNASGGATVNKTVKRRPQLLWEAFPSQFLDLLIKTAKQRSWFKHPITIAVDALDECDSIEDQVELLELMLQAVTTNKMRFIVTCRPERQVDAFFQREDASRHTYLIRLDEESFKASDDINTFLRAEFEAIRREFGLPETWPGDNAINQVKDMTDSQFIVARLAINYIKTVEFSPIEQLKILLDSPPLPAFDKVDAMYRLILSRRSPALLRESSEVQRHHRETITEILQIVIAWPDGPLSAPAIAKILRQSGPRRVEAIISGPMRSLFNFNPYDARSVVTLCHKSLQDHLLDRRRSKEYYIPAPDGDTLFLQLLSRQPPPNSSRNHLMAVLGVLADWKGSLTSAQIASILEIDSEIVETLVDGPQKYLFSVDDNKVKLSAPSLNPFLREGERSKEFFLPKRSPEVLFMEVLSRQRQSQDVFWNVLIALVNGREELTESQLAELLSIDRALLLGVLLGPARSLFDMDNNSKVGFSSPLLKPFFQDSKRSGPWFIPSTV